MVGLPYKEVLLLLFGTLSTYLIWRIKHQKEKIKNVESQLSDRKYKMYSDLIYILFDISDGDKVGKKVTEKELLKRLLDIKKDMFIYAPDAVFLMFTKWMLAIDNASNMTSHLKVYFELLRLVRKDMGHVKTKISLDDFMMFYMQSESEYEKFKVENGW